MFCWFYPLYKQHNIRRAGYQHNSDCKNEKKLVIYSPILSLFSLLLHILKITYLTVHKIFCPHVCQTFSFLFCKCVDQYINLQKCFLYASFYKTINFSFFSSAWKSLKVRRQEKKKNIKKLQLVLIKINNTNYTQKTKGAYESH